MQKEHEQDVHIDYPSLIDEAMRGVVRKALEQVAEDGLPGKHHFYITFSTKHPGVQVSPQIKQRYPEEMTIVLQYQFWDLEVESHYFSVMLSFNNVPERLVIPYDALTAFADPSIRFGLQFHARAAEGNYSGEQESSFEPDMLGANNAASPKAEVISLDAFRKK